MLKSKVTIRDVARAAGVSPGTASRALNGSPLVKESTRLRVQQAADRLQYQPNLLAKRLSLGKTLSVAILAPFFTRPAFVTRLQGIVEALQDTDYDLIIHNIDNPDTRTATIQRIMHPQRADGVILISLPLDAALKEIIATCTLPIVLIDIPNCDALPVNQIQTDDRTGGYQATRHLLDLGHRRIAFLGDSPDPRYEFTSSKYRQEGYHRALTEAGLPIDPNLERFSLIDRAAARVAATELLKQPAPPTAIFAASDTQALGVLEAARDQDLRVPQDLSVIGYDDLEIAQHVGLSTVHQQLVESGRKGGQILLRQLEDPNQPVFKAALATQVMPRKTTAPPGKAN